MRETRGLVLLLALCDLRSEQQQQRAGGCHHHHHALAFVHAPAMPRGRGRGATAFSSSRPVDVAAARKETSVTMTTEPYRDVESQEYKSKSNQPWQLKYHDIKTRRDVADARSKVSCPFFRGSWSVACRTGFRGGVRGTVIAKFLPLGDSKIWFHAACSVPPFPIMSTCDVFPRMTCIRVSCCCMVMFLEVVRTLPWSCVQFGGEAKLRERARMRTPGLPAKIIYARFFAVLLCTCVHFVH